MSVKLLTKHNLEFLSLKGECTGSPESTLLKIPHCWKSHVAAHIYYQNKTMLRFNFGSEYNVFVFSTCVISGQKDKVTIGTAAI